MGSDLEENAKSLKGSALLKKVVSDCCTVCIKTFVLENVFTCDRPKTKCNIATLYQY